MRDRENLPQFTSEAENLLQEYLAEIQKALLRGQTSQNETKEIIEELREHILQAYWKETSSKSVKVEPLHEILKTMGDPHEIASEYLVDRGATDPRAIRPSSGDIPSHRKLSSLKSYIPRKSAFFILVLPLIAAIGVYFLLILLFDRLKHLWVVFFAVSDFLLVIPLIWYQFKWKYSKSLGKWRITTPRKMRIYLIAGIVLLILSAMLLPSLRGRSDPHSRWYASAYDDPLNIDYNPTLDGGWTSENWDDYYYEYYISSQFLVLASWLTLFLVAIFLFTAFRAPIQWKQADIRMKLHEVKPPIHVDDTGVIKIQTRNYNPITFPQLQIEIQDQSPGFQTTIEPSSRTAFGPQDTVSWLIWFTPKVAGNLDFGRIVFRLGGSLTVSSPKYSLVVRGRESFRDSRQSPSQSEIFSDFPQTPDLTASCGICRQSFNPTDRVASCLLCGSLFHLLHLQEWLKGHDTCPNCSMQIKVSELDRTYGTLILERLEHLEHEFRHLRGLRSTEH
ncbi:MAG: HAAS signaling domain-containing protein [Candidatus Hodarchaeales archaeon]|jgi:hypothetical protein